MARGDPWCPWGTWVPTGPMGPSLQIRVKANKKKGAPRGAPGNNSIFLIHLIFPKICQNHVFKRFWDDLEARIGISIKKRVLEMGSNNFFDGFEIFGIAASSAKTKIRIDIPKRLFAKSSHWLAAPWAAHRPRDTG